MIDQIEATCIRETSLKLLPNSVTDKQRFSKTCYKKGKVTLVTCLTLKSLRCLLLRFAAAFLTIFENKKLRSPVRYNNL